MWICMHRTGIHMIAGTEMCVALHLKWSCKLSNFNEQWNNLAVFLIIFFIIKFYENPFSSSRIFVCTQTDRWQNSFDRNSTRIYMHLKKINRQWKYITSLLPTNCTSICLQYSYMCGPGSSVCIATDYGLDGPVLNPSGDEIFRQSRPAPGPTQPPVQWVLGLSQG